MNINIASLLQTWRDIKRKIRKQTLEANRSVETFDKDQVQFENGTMNPELEKIDEQESCNEDVDFPESSDGVSNIASLIHKIFISLPLIFN